VRPLLQKIGLVAGALLLVALLAWGVSSLMHGKSKGVHKAPKISLMPTTPPPPPPPPKEEKRPEPPKDQKEIKVDQPAPPKDAAPAPPSQELKMDGPAGDGPSAFSAGKITSDDISNLGKGGAAPVASGMFNPFNNYATAIKGDLQRFLARNKDLRQRAYRVDVQLWVGRDGVLSRHELLGSSGDTEVDELIRQSLSTLGNFSQLPPDSMPQPIRLRLVIGGR
jgi:periplasmic protein TonB